MRKVMFLIWMTTLLVKICSATFEDEESKIVTLSNAECMPRETVVSIDAPRYILKPSKVLIHRCDGNFQDMPPSLKRCAQNSSEILKLRVQNIFTFQSELFDLENHTSCKHQCVFDGSQCSGNQVWDSQNCQCTCNHEMRHTCPENHMWEPNLCQCVCILECRLRRHYLDQGECACKCKPTFYDRCNKRNKLLLQENCTCISPEAMQKGDSDCNAITTKWAVIIIVLVFLAIFILAFECILYTRKTGCIYHSTHICCDPVGSNEETIPIKNQKSNAKNHAVKV